MHDSTTPTYLRTIAKEKCTNCRFLLKKPRTDSLGYCAVNEGTTDEILYPDGFSCPKWREDDDEGTL